VLGRPVTRGQALVELALVVPILFFLSLAAIDLGRVFYSLITVTNAARASAMEAGSDSPIRPQHAFQPLTFRGSGGTTEPDAARASGSRSLSTPERHKGGGQAQGQTPSGWRLETGAAGLVQMIRRGSPTNSALAAAPRTGPIAGLMPNANEISEPRVQPA
jgi:hypothetical protein